MNGKLIPAKRSRRNSSDDVLDIEYQARLMQNHKKFKPPSFSKKLTPIEKKEIMAQIEMMSPN